MKRTSTIKYIIKVITFFILPLLSFGCSSVLTTVAEQIYLTVTDCRNVKTILDDTKIKLTIINQYHDDEYISALDSLDLSVECYKGQVYLVGEYDKPIQKERAVKIAKNVKGVEKVTSYLLPKNRNDICGIGDNLEIMLSVKTNLIGDKDIWARNIDVKSVQCHVILYGIVASDDKITKAIKHAKSVKGVRSVKSFLKSASKTDSNLMVQK
jgi:hyperosmotically inducible protein